MKLNRSHLRSNVYLPQKNKTQMHRKAEQEKEKRKGISPPPKEKGDPLNLEDKPVTSRYKYAFQGRDG